MQVTVAVVSFNTRELLLRCLASLAADARAGRADVWVVDNCSSDGSAQAAGETAPVGPRGPAGRRTWASAAR